MISCDDLIKKIKSYKPKVNEQLIRSAYEYGLVKHGDQKRDSGLPYFSHPIEVADIMIDMRIDEKTIAVALLHDTLEDTTATREELDLLFGEEIGGLVEGVTKLQKLDFVSRKAVQAENLRKLLLAVCDDVRVLLVKFADRLHNMRTLEGTRLEKRLRISEETLDIYAPLAGRMGMQDMREELEEIAFRYVNPEAWQLIHDKLDMISHKHKDLIHEIERTLTEAIKKAGIEAKVYGRRKAAWSIFRKMQRKAMSFEQLSDIYGFRAIVPRVSDCYSVLGIIHTGWSVVPGRFKDYISTPKHNGYQSLHTTIIGPSRQRIELQIRTQAMHDIAEYGVAAHSLYKDAVNLDVNCSLSHRGVQGTEDRVYSWLRHTLESLSEGANPEEFLEHTKLELFQDQLFCFTPKGALILLPYGATPIDFAYAVHTEIGNHCAGVKINGCIVSLNSELCNGDEVEIIRSPHVTVSPAWETIAITGKAKASIRRATKAAAKQKFWALGLKLLEKKFSSAGKVFSRESLGLVVSRLAREDIDDIITSVGRGELEPLAVVQALYPDYKNERYNPDNLEESGDLGLIVNYSHEGDTLVTSSNSNKDNLDEEDISSKAAKGPNKELPITFGAAGAVPGDRIVGILQPGVGIVIYPIQSLALMKYESNPDLWVDVRWDQNKKLNRRFATCIRMVVENKLGLLANISLVISEHDANIVSMVFNKIGKEFYEIFVELDVWDLNNLITLISRLKIIDSVKEVSRIYDERPAVKFKDEENK